MSAPARPSGIDKAELSSTVRVQDDLFGHVNSEWVARTPIPEDRGRYGSFDALREQAEADVRVIVEECVAVLPAAGTNERKIADLYSSFMETATVERAGIAPIEPLLKQIEQLSAPAQAALLIGQLSREGVDGIIHAYVSADVRQSEVEIAYLSQGGLGLPDESYYRSLEHAELRADYRAFVAELFELAGLYAGEQAQSAAQRVLDFETRLAAAHLDNVADRDALATYHKRTAAELAAEAGAFDIAAWARGVGFSEEQASSVVIRQPAFIAALGSAVTEVDLLSWQDWLRRELLTAFAPYLPAAFVNANFGFYGTRLTGTPQIRDRWKRGVGLVENCLGEALGQAYVARHYPPQAAERMQELVANLIAAFEVTFANLEWMSPATREEALRKLHAFRPKIGHPPRWKDYSALTIQADDLVGNVRRSSAVSTDRELAKIGQPVDRDEWLMTPQTVNAYYHPALNEIVFPAAILQPPFFDAQADDAVNYGGIGAVIAHEIGHGFDDQGSRYDGTGTLRDWWAPSDREAFDARAGQLISQFNALESVQAPGQFVNGALTVGENIGDLGGVTVGLRAYQMAIQASGEPAPVIDGLTGVQRFFIGWSQVWRGAARPQEAERLLAIDPHSPPEHRANIARNLQEFAQAFEVQPGDGMWLEPEQRVSVF